MKRFLAKTIMTVLTLTFAVGAGYGMLTVYGEPMTAANMVVTSTLAYIGITYFS